MTRLLLTAIFIASTHLALGLSADSLVRWRDLTYSSDFEKQVINDFLRNNKKDFLKAFLANAPSPVDNWERFNKKTKIVLDEIRESTNFKKRNDKKIKYIYQLIHERFFTQYQEEILFHEIIDNGKYNCVTATALYAWFFEQLGIPYTIKEEPTHVYLVAYPDSDNIIVESTSPLRGFIAFSPEFKARYVKNLKDQKMIGMLESSRSVDELFNKYYFGSGNINLTQLVGIHYMNDGLFRRDRQDRKGSFEQFKKGHFFYPGVRSEFLLATALGAVLESETEPVEKARQLSVASRYKAQGVTSEMIVGEFGHLSQATLIKKNDRALFEQCYKAITAELTDADLLKELKLIYNYENGRVLYNMGNYVAAKPYLVSAFELEPNNADLTTLVVACLTQALKSVREGKVVVDSLESYRTRFPILNEDRNFKSVLAFGYTFAFADAYEKGKIVEGEKFRNLFEALYNSDKTIKISPEAVGAAYSSACTHYFRKGQTAKAKQYIEIGLSIAPGNHELMMRRQMIGQ